MNYYGRISTANSLTHYGVLGMKWGKRKAGASKKSAIKKLVEAFRPATPEEKSAASERIKMRSEQRKKYANTYKNLSTNKRNRVDEQMKHHLQAVALNHEVIRLANEQVQNQLRIEETLRNQEFVNQAIQAHMMMQPPMF